MTKFVNQYWFLLQNHIIMIAIGKIHFKECIYKYKLCAKRDKRGNVTQIAHLLKFFCLSGCAMEKKHKHRELCVPRITEQHYLTPQDGAICITDHLVLVPSKIQSSPTHTNGSCAKQYVPLCILDNLNFLSHLFHTGLAFFE